MLLKKSSLPEPNESELINFYQDNHYKYTSADRYSFEHLFFKKGPDAFNQAQNAALELYAALKAAKTLWQQTPSAVSLEHIKKRFDQHPEISLEYFEIREETTLETFDPKHHQYTRAFIAAQLGKIRLIDNLALEKAIPLQHANRSC